LNNTEFIIDNAKLNDIADAFSLKRQSVITLYEEYTKLSRNMGGQYLAHIIRSMEGYIREKSMKPLFVINCAPFKSIVSGQKDAGSHYYKDKRFVIYFNPNLSERNIRVLIAHELGHLFLQAMYDIEGGKYVPKYESTTEPLSSILGIFTISDKNEFYRRAACSDRNHPNWRTILDDFLKL
jgi:hypothetical protein